jgi:hypothetical protein
MNPLWRAAWRDVLAIGPIWLACGLGAAAAPLWSAVRLDPVAVIAYVFGAVAIGAHVVGHEYSHRTLAVLLAQPVRRATTLAIKLAVVAVALVALTAVASAGPYSPIQRFPAHTTLDSRVIYLPTLMGLTLAPYLALVARSTLGGAVFSIGVPGALLVLGDLLGLAIYGLSRPGEIDRFKYAFFTNTTIAACLLAAVATWRRFARLEVLGDASGPAGHVSLPMLGPWAARDRARSTHAPLWLLMTKELRLQQMVFIIVAMSLLGMLSLWGLERSRQLAGAVPWPGLTLLYGCIVSVVIGALASAEERQLGTLDWQGLMPVSRRTQFAVKIAVVLGLAAACGALLPAGIAMTVAVPSRAMSDGFVVWMCLACLACAVGGLYVSTMSSSGVKAVALALPFVAAAFVVLRGASHLLWYAVQHDWFSRSWIRAGRLTEVQAQSVAALALAGIAVVLLLLAQRNHWTAPRTTSAVAAQMTAITAAIGVAGIAMFVVGFR